MSDDPSLIPTPPSSETPAHYRLSGKTWAVILDEYVRGATVPELALKWRVSEHALRKRITVHGSTKRDHGDREAMAQAQAWQDRAAERADNSPEARAARLFDPNPDEDEAAGDPAALARAAIRASGRAMRERLWVEAKALAGLAESYGRVGDRAGGGGGGGGGGVRGGGYTLEDMVRIVFDAEFRQETMTMHPERDNPPEKSIYWRLWREQSEIDGMKIAVERSAGYATGRKEARAEMGLDPEPRGADHYVWYSSALVRRSAVERRQREAEERKAQWALNAAAQDEDTADDD